MSYELYNKYFGGGGNIRIIFPNNGSFTDFNMVYFTKFSTSNKNGNKSYTFQRGLGFQYNLKMHYAHEV